MMGFSRSSTVITFLSFLYVQVTQQPDKRTAISCISIQDRNPRLEAQLEARYRPSTLIELPTTRKRRV
jgi:hypothetical protein